MATIEPTPYDYGRTEYTRPTSGYYYYYSTIDSTTTKITWTYTYTVRGKEEEIEFQPVNWKELAKHFNGFKAKSFNVNNRSYNIRQPVKCHRNVRRERIHRLKRSLL